MDELRHALRTCDLCAYIDLGVELVLSVSAVQKPPQEQLDALAKLAAGLLAQSPSCAPANPASGGAPDPSPDVTTFLTKTQTYVLLRSPNEPGEVILCRCGPHVDPSALAAGAHVTLKWIRDAA